MNNFCDFSTQGYQVIRELGRNPAGGRVVYLAQTNQGEYVVIKQFQFAKGGSNWDGFKVIEREVQTLKDLKHPGIPRYQDSFETADSFCLVQEYKQGRMLSETRSFTPAEIKQIAVELLEILVYLQERMPPVIHRDIKPENILVDDSLNVYLIDFGFARVGSGTVAISSVNAGTFSFMAPEQVRNQKLTNASDLYGLGLTLVCAIGGIQSNDIGGYIDCYNQLDHTKIDAKLKGCSRGFIDWVHKMTAPNPMERYADAQTALEALLPIDVRCVSSVKYRSKHLSSSNQRTEAPQKRSQTGAGIFAATIFLGTTIMLHPQSPLRLLRPTPKISTEDIPTPLKKPDPPISPSIAPDSTPDQIPSGDEIVKPLIIKPINSAVNLKKLGQDLELKAYLEQSSVIVVVTSKNNGIPPSFYRIFTTPSSGQKLEQILRNLKLDANGFPICNDENGQPIASFLVAPGFMSDSFSKGVNDGVISIQEGIYSGFLPQGVRPLTLVIL